MEEMTQRLDDKTDKQESFSKRDNLKFFIVAESTEADIYIYIMDGWDYCSLSLCQHDI